MSENIFDEKPTKIMIIGSLIDFSENKPEFTRYEFKEFIQSSGIKINKTTIYNKFKELEEDDIIYDTEKKSKKYGILYRVKPGFKKSLKYIQIKKLSDEYSTKLKKEHFEKESELHFLLTIEETLNKIKTDGPKYPGERWPDKPEWYDFDEYICPPVNSDKISADIENGILKKLLFIGESGNGKSVAALFIGKKLADKGIPTFYLNVGDIPLENRRSILIPEYINKEISSVEENGLIIFDDLHRDPLLSLEIIKLLLKSKYKSNFVITTRDTIKGRDIYDKLMLFLEKEGKEILMKENALKQVVKWLLSKKKSVPVEEIERISKIFIDIFHNLALISCALSEWEYKNKIKWELVYDRALNYLEKIDEALEVEYSAREIIYYICALWQYEIPTAVSLFSLLNIDDKIIRKLINIGEISKVKQRYEIKYHPQIANLFLNVAEKDSVSKGLKEKIMNHLNWKLINSIDLSSLILIFSVEKKLIQEFIPLEELHGHMAYQGKTQIEKFAQMTKNYLEYREKQDRFNDEIAVWILVEYGDIYRRRSSANFKLCKLRLKKAINIMESLNDKNIYKKYMGNALYNLAYIEYLQNNFSKAEKLFKDSAKFEKNQGGNLSSLMSDTQGIIAYWRQNKIKRSEDCLSKLKKNLDNFRKEKGKDAERWVGSALLWISYILIENGRYDEAEKNLNEAEEIWKRVAPGALLIFDIYRGIIFNNKKNFEKAKNFLQKALKKAGMERKALIYLHLGIAYESINFQEAIKSYEKALLSEECDPNMDNIEYLKMIRKRLQDMQNK